ncbi:hypothetical protein BASA81_003154 [Batrachochytrium salamandrivorans]|nr:hypothetical protein BASA81_003154 [Batrachochytrium salamandrivorans]
MSGVISVSEPAAVVFEGYMTKRAVVSGRNWKRRYFVLYSDGLLSYKKDNTVDTVKKSIQLGAKSKAMVLKELSSEGGVYVEGPTHDALYLKADSMKEAKQWIQVLNDLTGQLQLSDATKRNNTLEVFAKSNKQDAQTMLQSSRNLGSQTTGQSTRNLGSQNAGMLRVGVKEKRTPPPPEGGWEMRVGNKDVFVDANTWMFYADKTSYLKSGKVLGKAELASLV